MAFRIEQGVREGPTVAGEGARRRRSRL